MPDKKHRPICPACNRSMTLELQPGGKTPRTFQCIDCEPPDPFEIKQATGWMNGELGREE